MAMFKEFPGPTPNGGVKSTVFYQDEDGEAAEEADAKRAMIVEYGEGGDIVHTTYGELGTPHIEDSEVEGQRRREDAEVDNRRDAEDDALDAQRDAEDGDEPEPPDVAERRRREDDGRDEGRALEDEHTEVRRLLEDHARARKQRQAARDTRNR